MSKSNFFGRPTLGGCLSILNGLLLVGTAALCRFFPTVFDYSPVLSVLALIGLTVPFGFFLWLPSLGGGPSRDEAIAHCILMGFNSLAWGYGLAAILRKTSAGIRRVRARIRPETEASAAS